MSYDSQISLFGFGAISYAVFKICDVVDAIKVARVNNLTYRDKRKGLSKNIEFRPFIFVNSSQNSNTALGVTIKFSY